MSFSFHVSFVCYACFALVRFARLCVVLYVIACSMLLCFGVGLSDRPRLSLHSASLSCFSPGPFSFVFCRIECAFGSSLFLFAFSFAFLFVFAFVSGFAAVVLALALGLVLVLTLAFVLCPSFFVPSLVFVLRSSLFALHSSVFVLCSLLPVLVFGLFFDIVLIVISFL